MQENIIVSVPLEMLERICNLLDKAKNSEAAPFIAGLTLGAILPIVQTAKEEAKRLKGEKSNYEN